MKKPVCVTLAEELRVATVATALSRDALREKRPYLETDPSPLSECGQKKSKDNSLFMIQCRTLNHPCHRIRIGFEQPGTLKGKLFSPTRNDFLETKQQTLRI
ncbi:hypothetical protein CEXT_208591 [Caerostris extrusa]|uniref:Uncharacterized protein n=1 Tax=Caerostris extrusa TaxID=172846 RepID=A0AAV4XJ76_CAEEX|nr:hypothetical protein CEXT_208591 [Caerostris extrusa]